MDWWKLRSLPKPKSLTTANVRAALPRGVDRRHYRMTPAGIADYWTRRNTPLLSSPLARTTPRPAMTLTGQSIANYHSWSSPTPPVASVTNISFLTSAVDVKKHSLEIKKSRTETGVFKSTGSDVTELGDVDNTGSNIITMTTTSSSSSKSINHLATWNYLTDQQAVQQDDVSTQNEVTSVSRDALTSQYGATRDDKVSGVDVRAQVIEAENGRVQANFTASTRAGETMMMMSYLSDDTGGRATTPLNDASDREETLSDADDMLSASSNGVTKYTSLNNMSLVMSSTRENNLSINNSTANDAISQSANIVDLHSTSDQSVLGRSGGTSMSTRSSSLSAATTVRTLNETGRSRSMTSASREQSARTWPPFTGRPTPTSSSVDDTISLWPRRVLLKSANTTDSDTSSLYWSSHLVIPLLTIAVVLALCLLVIAVACAVRYASKYCCCFAPRAGSYTPSPSPPGYRVSKSVTGNQRQARRAHAPREHVLTKPTRAAQLAVAEPAYRSVVIIGSDRLARRAVASRNPPRQQWIVRQKTGSTWGNLSQVTNDTSSLPPPPPPPRTIVLGRERRDDDVIVDRTVSHLEGRIYPTTQSHHSRPKLYTSYDTE